MIPGDKEQDPQRIEEPKEPEPVNHKVEIIDDQLPGLEGDEGSGGSYGTPRPFGEDKPDDDF